MPGRWLIPLGSIALSLLADPAIGQQGVTLGRGDHPAGLISGTFGQGDAFRIELTTDWAGNRPQERTPVDYRLTLPDGRVLSKRDANSSVGSRSMLVEVPAESVRNLPGERVRVAVEVLAGEGGLAISNRLLLDTSDFPRTPVNTAEDDPGPFGWGKPLGPENRVIPQPGPQGFRFANIGPAEGSPVYLATTEATNAQVRALMKTYDPKRGRSDEFNLEAPDQPAVGLNADEAGRVASALNSPDAPGLRFRLPTSEEWFRAARAGRTTRFWWGTEPTHPRGANLIGPEPSLAIDSTAPASPTGKEGFQANTWGLIHTFGNVDEWATGATPGKYLRLGGNFRTEPEDAGKPTDEHPATDLGPDPFVGVRPALAFDREPVERSLLASLAKLPGLAEVRVRFDPGRATATLEGKAPDGHARRLADQALQKSWYVAGRREPDRAAGPGARAGRRDPQARREAEADGAPGPADGRGPGRGPLGGTRCRSRARSGSSTSSAPAGCSRTGSWTASPGAAGR